MWLEMATRSARGVVAFALLAVLLVATALAVGMLPRPQAGEQPETELAGPAATITITDENGTVLGVVNASVAASSEERYTGLSPYESLANGSGKLFVYDKESNRTFVMRKMDFPLDIVFIGADGRINVIHKAPVPPDGTEELKRYRGSGQWVLEVPRGWMAAQGISEGDYIEIEYRDSPMNITTVPEDG